MAQNNSKKLSHVGSNIKKIRQVKKISQADFAALFELARPSVGAYEEGRSEPKIETIISIANYFRLSVDVLLTRDLTVSEIFSLGQLNQKLDKAHGKDVGGEHFSGIEKTGLPLIKRADYLDYIVSHRTMDYIRGLEHIQIPYNLKGTVRAFEMAGSEMEYHQQGLHHTDILVTRQVDVKQVKKLINEIVVVVHSDQIFTRRLDNENKSSMVFVTDDPNYEPITVPREELLELWVVEAVMSQYLHKPSLLEERVLRLEKDLEQLRQAMK